MILKSLGFQRMIKCLILFFKILIKFFFKFHLLLSVGIWQRATVLSCALHFRISPLHCGCDKHCVNVDM